MWSREKVGISFGTCPSRLDPSMELRMWHGFFFYTSWNSGMASFAGCLAEGGSGTLEVGKMTSWKPFKTRKEKDLTVEPKTFS
jgi:hypothetical protein